MARITKPLSPTEVKQTKPKDKLYKLFDGSGLVLKVKPNGTKSWVLIYNKPFIKKRSEISFGNYPAISLSDAHKLKQNALDLLAKDIDPKDHRLAKENEKKRELINTLQQVAANWYEVKKAEISADHANDIWRSLEIHILPELGAYPISNITAPLVTEELKPLAAKGTLETVKRLSQRLNEIMNYAVNTELVHANPLTGIKAAFKKPEKQNMPTLNPEQLPELMNAISYASIKIVTRCLIEGQLHTMVRPSEAAGAKWSELDLENKLWLIPAERMKKNESIPSP